MCPDSWFVVRVLTGAEQWRYTWLEWGWRPRRSCGVVFGFTFPAKSYLKWLTELDSGFMGTVSTYRLLKFYLLAISNLDSGFMEISNFYFFQLLSVFCRQFLGVTVDRWNAHFRCFWGNFSSVKSLFLILNVFGLKCWTKHGTSPLVHVREVECLTGKEPTNTKRPILVNSFCVFLLLSSALITKCFEVHSKHTEQQLCWSVLIPTHKTLLVSFPKSKGLSWIEKERIRCFYGNGGKPARQRLAFGGTF